MRHLALIALLAVPVAGCGATGPSSSATETSPGRTALSTPAATTVAIPSATQAAAPPTPTPSPKVVAGWPTVSRGGVTMTGRTVSTGDWAGGPSGPVIRVKVTGLDPDEVVALSGTGSFDGGLLCGPRPSGCGGDTTPDCLPAHWKPAKGQVAVAEEAAADAGGTARATLRFVMPETTEACPVAGGDPGWLQVPNSWKVRVTDEAHGLRLAPKRYTYGP